MAYAEKLVKSWRACWKGPDGKPQKLSGFDTKKQALDHATEQEVDGRRRGARAVARSHMSLEEWALDWYAALDLEPSTMRRYLSYLQNHVIPKWGDWALRDLQDADHDIARWTNDLDGAGYSANTIRSIRGILHSLCADATDQGHMSRNPAAAKRRRGRIAPKRRAIVEDRRSKKVLDPLTALLIAERCAVLSGRDDLFTLVVTMFYTGARFGEAIGIERDHIYPRLAIRSQLHPGKTGLQYRAPKDGSVRTLDVPPFLADLLAWQGKQAEHPKVEGAWCPCGEGEPEKYRHPPGIHVFSGPRGRPHWLRGAFADRFLYAAARGRFFAGQPGQRPVYVEPREDGTYSMVDWSRSYSQPAGAVACWAPLAPGLVAHSLRHSHKTLMEELGTPQPLMNERMGHSDASVQARYSHPTREMRRRLVEGLQGQWERALKKRAAMEAEESPVPLVEGLLAPHRGRDSRSAPDTGGYQGSPVRGIVA